MNQKARDIFDAAIGHATPEEYIARACDGDPDLKNFVHGMLAAHQEALQRGFLGDATAATVMAPAGESTGGRIGPYKLLQQIGEGGFGVVFMAEQQEPVRRRVALKVIKLGMDTKAVIARFEAERQALAMMDHPNIAKVLDAGATDTGRPYFVMELVRGDAITQYCDAARLSTRDRLALFTDVCHAVQHAHTKGIIHRDLKPSNVLVTIADGKPIPKVIDFGIAKATIARLTEKTLFTEHRTLIGTPEYMSPEQADTSGIDIDTRSDIYSLGVLLYELLTGTTPFDSERLRSAAFGELQRIIREVEPPRPSTRVGTLGDSLTSVADRRRTEPRRLTHIIRGDLDWIVMRCLEKDRTRRYETASGLAQDIQRHLAGEAVLAAPPSAAYRVRKFVRRHRVGVATFAALTALLLLGAAGTTAGMLRARAAEARATLELARTTEVKRLITQMISGVDPQRARQADTALLRGILDDTAARLTKGEVKDELIAAELHNLIGQTYMSLGIYDAAERHLPAALDIRARLLGDQHADTAVSLHNLAMLYSERARYREAEALQLRAIAAATATLGENHLTTLAYLTGLGTIYGKEERYSEAEPLFVKTYQGRLRELGPDHDLTLTAMDNLASVYESQGRLSEAEPLHVRSFEAHRRTLGADHPHTLRSMGGLANCYLVERKFDKAAELQTGLLEIRKRILPPEHPDLLASMTNLAVTYALLGEHEKSRDLLETCLPIKRRVLGTQHPYTRTAMRALTRAYVRLGRRADALALRRELVELAVADAEKPDARPAVINEAARMLISEDYEELQDAARALPLCRRACALEEAAKGPQLWAYLDLLAFTQSLTGDVAGAIKTQERAIALAPPGEPSVKDMKESLEKFRAAPK